MTAADLFIRLMLAGSTVVEAMYATEFLMDSVVLPHRCLKVLSGIA